MEVMDPSLEEPQEQPALVDPVKTGKKEDKGKKDRQTGVNGKKGDHQAVLFLLIVPAGVGKRKYPGFNGYYKLTTVHCGGVSPVSLHCLWCILTHLTNSRHLRILRPFKWSTTKISMMIFLFDMRHMNCVKSWCDEPSMFELL